MVRLKSIKKVRVVDPESDSEGPGLEVTFEGPVGESARCEITLTMKDHGTDIDVVRAAEINLRTAVGILHTELLQAAQNLPSETL
jgi:hypothetical protein